MLNIHRFKLDKNAKSKTKTTHFTKQKHVLTRVTWFFDRGRNDKTYKRASSFDFNSSQMSSKLFSLVPANYLILFLSMCACNLFNVRQAWIESHAWRPLKKSAIKQFEVVLKEFCVIHVRWTSCASLNAFIYSATRKKCLISRFTDKRKEVLILSVIAWCIYLQKNILLKTLLLFVYLTTLPLLYRGYM